MGDPTPQLPFQLWQRHPHLQQGPNNDAFHLTRGQPLQNQGRWSHCIRHDSRGAALSKAEKWEASGKTPERRLLGGLLKGHRNCQGSQAGLSSIPQGNVYPGRVPWPDINFQRNGPGDQPPEYRDLWGVGGLGWQAGTESHQPHHKSLPMGHTIFLHSIDNQVTHHHGV